MAIIRVSWLDQCKSLGGTVRGGLNRRRPLRSVSPGRVGVGGGGGGGG